MSTQSTWIKQGDHAISVTGEVRDVHHPVTSDLIGKVISEQYSGKALQRHWFVPSGRTDEEAYSLGATTTGWRFSDHHEALAPLLSLGYTVKKVIPNRKGIHFHLILTRPSGVQLADPITWDHHIWTPAADPTLEESVIVTLSIKPGHSLSFRKGWYRLICTNGLTLEILKLGSLKMAHTAYDAKKIEAFGQEQTFLGIEDDPKKIMGPRVGTTKGVAQVQRLLSQATAEGDQFKVPFFLEDVLKPVTNLPPWYLEGLQTQFEAMVNAGRDMYALDLANAVTSPVSLETLQSEPRASLRPIDRADTLISSLAKLTAVLSL